MKTTPFAAIYPSICQAMAGLILAFSLSSCEQVVLGPAKGAPPEVFDYLWEDIHQRYAYFELKGIDWQAARTQYRPRAQAGMSEQDLFDLLAELLFELRDGHVNLTSSFDRSRNWEWFQDFPENYHHTLVERNYLGKDYQITGPLLNQIIDSVLYVNYRSFGAPISAAHLDHLMERAQGLKGVLIDVRNNGGGSLSNAYMLAACFATEPRIFAQERIKTGPSPEDFSDWRPLSVTPRSGPRFTGKVVVLTNRRSYSATTFFAQMMKSLPQAVLMGDQTGGGGGIPVFGELPNGWIYRFSATQSISPDGQQLELGVPVDIPVSLDEEDAQKGVDSMIEAGLEKLKG